MHEQLPSSEMLASVEVPSNNQIPKVAKDKKLDRIVEVGEQVLNFNEKEYRQTVTLATT